VVALALGLGVPVNRHVILGAAYEFGISRDTDVLDDRVTMNVTVEY
jgi:hypothetical protein